jgi:hypothetical protein
VGICTLAERHPGWDLCAARSGDQVTWHARPQGSGADPFTGWDAPGVLHADSAEALDKLLGSPAQNSPGIAPR